MSEFSYVITKTTRIFLLSGPKLNCDSHEGVAMALISATKNSNVKSPKHKIGLRVALSALPRHWA